jgi:hypothetical protein
MGRSIRTLTSLTPGMWRSISKPGQLWRSWIWLESWRAWIEVRAPGRQLLQLPQAPSADQGCERSHCMYYEYVYRSTSQTTSHCSNWWAHERPHQWASGRACGPPRERAHNRARRRTCGRVCEQVHAERIDRRAAKRVAQARAGHVDGRAPSASTGVRPSERRRDLAREQAR